MALTFLGLKFVSVYLKLGFGVSSSDCFHSCPFTELSGLGLTLPGPETLSSSSRTNNSNFKNSSVLSIFLAQSIAVFPSLFLFCASAFALQQTSPHFHVPSTDCPNQWSITAGVE